MLGERAEELIGYHRAHGTHPVLACARAQVTCRSRDAEDSLAGGVRRGISQYVILGAGLDSFARRSPQARHMRVLEIDHPATQEWKRRVQPGVDGVTSVPVDFTRNSLGDRLGQARFDFAEPAFGQLARRHHVPGPKRHRVDPGRRRRLRGRLRDHRRLHVSGLRDAAGDSYAEQVGQAFAERGEPWLSCFGPGDMAALLGGHGFGAIREVAPAGHGPHGGLGLVRWPRPGPPVPHRPRHDSRPRLKITPTRTTLACPPAGRGPAASSPRGPAAIN